MFIIIWVFKMSLQFKSSPLIAIYNTSGIIIGKLKFSPQFSKWQFYPIQSQVFDKDELSIILNKMRELK